MPLPCTQHRSRIPAALCDIPHHETESGKAKHVVGQVLYRERSAKAIREYRRFVKGSSTPLRQHRKCMDMLGLLRSLDHGWTCSLTVLVRNVHMCTLVWAAWNCTHTCVARFFWLVDVSWCVCDIYICTCIRIRVPYILACSGARVPFTGSRSNSSRSID